LHGGEILVHTNIIIMKKHMVLVIIFLLTTQCFLQQVHAAQTLMSPQFFDLLQKEAFFTDAFSATDPAQLTDEQMQSILVGGIFAGSLPNVGVIVETAAGYGVATGLSGTAMGTVKKGLYTVSIKPIDGVEMRLPNNPLDLTGGENTKEYVVLMKNKSGSGSVVYEAPSFSLKSIWNTVQTVIRTTFSTLSQRFSQKPLPTITTTVGTSAEGFSGQENTVSVTVKLVNDVNGDGIVDTTDPLVPWANVSLTFTPSGKK